MKEVNLYGMTTAEKLLALEKAYKEVINSLIVSANPRGSYSAATPYSYGDMVNDNGSSYLYINETTAQGIPVTNTEYWFMIAEKGNDGQNGKDGINGQDGAVGPRGLTGTGISHITMGTPYVSGENTVTPLNFEYTDGTAQNLAAYAKNGQGSGLNPMYRYRHNIEFVTQNPDNSHAVSGNVVIDTGSSTPMTSLSDLQSALGAIYTAREYPCTGYSGEAGSLGILKSVNVAAIGLVFNSVYVTRGTVGQIGAGSSTTRFYDTVKNLFA